MRIQLFNLETMSGVFPGVRTQEFQRIFLRPLPGQPAAADSTEGTGGWAHLFWYDEPRACVLHAPDVDSGTGQTEGTPSTDAAHTLRIEEPQASQLLPTLQEKLAAEGWQMLACGSCAHWQPHRSGGEQVEGEPVWDPRGTEELPFGRCGWRGGDDLVPPWEFAPQGALAMGCPRWQSADDPPAENSPAQLTDLAPEAAPGGPAEQDERSWWAQLLSFVTRQWKGKTPDPSDAREPLSQRILERSGVGAGTQPCFVCQGRIANLGALVVETPEGDRQTFSMWRCRNCCTYYLNDWIDRWERLDSLETQERFYRVAPAEAWLLLQRIESVAGGDHPRHRAERVEQRRWFETFLAEREPLSHQVKFGR